MCVFVYVYIYIYIYVYITGCANSTATRHRVVIPAKWNWGTTTGVTTLRRVAPPHTWGREWVIVIIIIIIIT